MELSVISTALAVLRQTEATLKRVRQRALTSADASLEQDVRKLHDDFLALKAVTILIVQQGVSVPQRRPEAVFNA
jgi:hypothetical protein